jgi:hypothetical protein
MMVGADFSVLPSGHFDFANKARWPAWPLNATPYHSSFFHFDSAKTQNA